MLPDRKVIDGFRLQPLLRSDGPLRVSFLKIWTVLGDNCSGKAGSTISATDSRFCKKPVLRPSKIETWIEDGDEHPWGTYSAGDISAMEVSDQPMHVCFDDDDGS